MYSTLSWGELFPRNESAHHATASAYEDIADLVMLDGLKLRERKLIIVPLNDCQTLSKPGVGTHWFLAFFDIVFFHVGRVGHSSCRV